MTATVGANLLFVVPGDVGGSETYVARLLDVARTDPELAGSLRLYVNRAFPAAHPDLVEAFPTEVAPVDGRHRWARVAAEASWLALRARHQGVALLHHFGGTVPLVHPTPSVVTIHDLQYLALPQFFAVTKLAYLRSAVPAAVRRARLVLTPSAFVRETVIAELGVSPERVLVSPPALGLARTPIDERAQADVRRRYGLTGRIVLYPARTWPHKNHVVLVRAVARLREEVPDVTLVLTGGEDAGEAELAAEIERLGLGRAVRRLGHVPAADRDALVAASDVVAFPSRYEGFGNPVLEAMAAGTPVVAADATALPEACGGAALLVDPRDEQAWAGALRTVLTDPAVAADLVRRGRERAARWDDGEAVAALRTAYQRALEMG